MQKLKTREIYNVFSPDLLIDAARFRKEGELLFKRDSGEILISCECRGTLCHSDPALGHLDVDKSE